ncbi:signal peptidase I [Clostridium tarantellae]|uniref:Signal peptidase I n=1 Tax=Clostridium tarantellae TaxID=39493 RepID=A0A6I1MU61_9CLOT|nr:signal peptidase I [Clostridium tarantellae]MPQ44401.1 signal peptidase I [Clostridium tarantellae]
MINKKKKIMNIISYIFLALIILVLVNNILTKSDKIFKTIGFRTYTILTGSMSPEIEPGDLVVIKHENPEKLNVNDIITFNYDNKIVTHRIIEKEEAGFITKGDNNNVEDSEVIKSKDVIGKVLTVIPKLGYLFSFTSHPLFVPILLVIIALSILWDVFSKKEDNIKEKNKNI